MALSEAPQCFKEKPSDNTTHYTHKEITFIIWALGHGSYFKNKFEFNIDVHKQRTEYVFSLCLPLATVSGVSYLNFKEIIFFTS